MVLILAPQPSSLFAFFRAMHRDFPRGSNGIPLRIEATDPHNITLTTVGVSLMATPRQVLSDLKYDQLRM